MKGPSERDLSDLEIMVEDIGGEFDSDEVDIRVIKVKDGSERMIVQAVYDHETIAAYKWDDLRNLKTDDSLYLTLIEGLDRGETFDQICRGMDHE